MVRPLRLEFPGALYHVTSRGDRREDIYEDDDDREKFLEILASVVSDYNWSCHSYCLMSNHYHLLIETHDGNLSKGMRQLNGVFTQASKHTEKVNAPAPLSLAEIVSQTVDRNTSIIAAYDTGAYSQREIGEYFGIYPSTVGVIV